jgi:hypothetical protein
MFALLFLGSACVLHAQEATSEEEHPVIKRVREAFPEPEGAKRLLPDKKWRLWVDREKKKVIVDGYVALEKGTLELFACVSGTKEHESAVALLAPASNLHAALLTIDATPGHPVQFEPYRPASGQRIAIEIHWKDPEGKSQTVNAKEWVREIASRKALTVDWIFAGSGFWKDPADGREHYMANSGDVICVSNFATAMLDLPIESTAQNGHLAYEVYPERVPKRGTPVRVTLTPLPDRSSVSSN